MNDPNWKHLFSDRILSRGHQYYASGKVKSIERNGMNITAIVDGSIKYEVKIELDADGSISDMSCDCPYANGFNPCKHMAAVLYYMEKGAKNAPPKPQKIALNSVISCPESHDLYFNINKIASPHTTTPENVEAAERILSDKKTGCSFRTYYTDDFSGGGIHIGVRLSSRDAIRNYTTELSCSQNETTRVYCNCAKGWGFGAYAYHSRVNFCEHMVAAFSLLSSYIQENNPGDATDISGDMLLSKAHIKKRTIMQKNPGRTVTLNLRLLKEYDNCVLGLKCGHSKLYVVKDIGEFVTSYENKETYSLGKTDCIDFSADTISDECMPIFNFIKAQFLNIDAIEKKNYFHFTKGRDQYFLSSANIDDVYELAKKNGVTYSDSSCGIKDVPVTASSQSLNLCLKAVKKLNSSGNFEGISVQGVIPQIIEGKEYSYYLRDNALYRITKENSEYLSLFSQTAQDELIEFTIGKKRLPEFFYSFVPGFKKYVEFDLSAVSDLEANLPPDINLVFYLDAENGIPFCSILAAYGDSEFPLTDLKQNSGYEYANKFKENEAVDTVKRYFSIPDKEHFRCSDDDASVFSLLEDGISALLELGEVNSTNKFDALKVRRKVSINIGVSIKSDLMELDIKTTDISPDELVDILNSCKLKKKYHRLKSGGFVKIDESIEELDKIINNLHIPIKNILKQNIQIPAFRALYLDSMLSEFHDIDSEKDKMYKNFIKNFKTVKESDFEVPSSLKNVMRDYQKFGHKWIRTVTGCGFGTILADDMGLGKTLQVISVILSSKEEKCNLPSLVICPASLVYNWEEEFQKFAPSLNIGIVSGSAADRKKIIKRADKFDVLVTSYDLLKRDISEYEGTAFEYQILDEAQNIKNHNTAASKSVKIISGKKRIALTGTPIENRLSELWSIFDYLMPGFLYGYDVFRHEFETPIVKNTDADAAAKLRKMISPFVLRRLKNDVLKDLPEKTEEIRYAQFEDAQQKIYDGQVIRMRRMLESSSEESFSKGKLQILSELTKIRRICCDPNLIFEDYDGGSAKRSECMNLISEAIAGNHKMLVFSQFTSMLALLEKDLSSENIPYYIITGETDKRMRTNLVKKFNEDSTPVFLISLKAGGTGLNLTGADIVIHYDPWWNVAVQNQATDRAYRIGQKNMVSVYKLIVKNSIEEKIINMQKQKSELADAVLNENSASFSSLSKDDILKLLK